MATYTIAVCDDEEIHIQTIIQFIKAYESEMKNQIHIISYQDSVKLLNDYKEKTLKADILFLDVDMPEISGVELAEIIREENENIPICFITAYDNYAYQAFRIEATGYIMKPIQYLDLKKLINKCIIELRYLKLSEEANDRYLNITSNRDTLIVDLKKVIYIEKRRNQCIFHLEDGEVICYETLMRIYEKLNHDIFYFVHQGYIVNFNAIKEVRPQVICLGENREIPLSRKYHAKMKELHMDKIRQLQKQKNQK